MEQEREKQEKQAGYNIRVFGEYGMGCCCRASIKILFRVRGSIFSSAARFVFFFLFFRERERLVVSFLCEKEKKRERERCI